MRRWKDAWIGALFVVGVGGLCRWVVFSPGGTAAGVLDGVCANGAWVSRRAKC
jgi:hypothetical protein